MARGHVRVLHVPSRYQIVDIFTKGPSLVLFEDFRNSLNVCEPPASTEGCVRVCNIGRILSSLYIRKQEISFPLYVAYFRGKYV